MKLRSGGRFAVAAVLLLPALLAAQTFRGGVQGHVTDSTGAAMPGTTVTASNVGTRLARSAVADSMGNYSASSTRRPRR